MKIRISYRVTPNLDSWAYLTLNCFLDYSDLRASGTRLDLVEGVFVMAYGRVG